MPEGKGAEKEPSSISGRQERRSLALWRAAVPFLRVGSASPMSAGSEESKAAGRGGLAVLAAKVYFIVVGLVQQVALRGVLGLDGYGALSTALSAASIAYNPITQASIQGVSRELAKTTAVDRPQVMRRLLGWHGSLGVALGLVFGGLGRPLSLLLGAPHIGSALVVLGVVLAAYGVYTPLVGVLNARRDFLKQAGFDVLATTLRTAGLLGGAYLASREWLPARGSTGAALGFAVASVVVVSLALHVVGLGRAGPSTLERSEYAAFLWPLLRGQIVLNLLFQADSLLLRRFAADAAEVAGVAASAADPFVGAYRGAQLFCFLPYQLLMSVTLVLFPLLASAKATGDAGKVEGLVRSGLRLALLLAGLMVCVFVARAPGLLALFMGADGSALGATAMRILSPGLGAFALLGVITTAQNGLGAARESSRGITVAFVLVVALCFAATRGVRLGEDLLVRTALATATGLFVATLFAFAQLRRVAGKILEGGLLLRTLSAAGIACAVGWAIPERGLVLTLGGSVATGAVYLGVLIALRELGTDDLERLRALARPKA